MENWKKKDNSLEIYFSFKIKKKSFVSCVYINYVCSNTNLVTELSSLTFKSDDEEQTQLLSKIEKWICCLCSEKKTHCFKSNSLILKKKQSHQKQFITKFISLTLQNKQKI